MKGLKRSYIRQILDAIDENTISFAGGLPNENLFPKNKLKKASEKVFENKSALQYSKSQGLDTLREKIAEFYTKKLDFPTTKDEILITTGSQQAFDIIAKSFLRKEVLVQTPTYIGALSAFKVLGLKVKAFNKISNLKKDLKKNSALYIMSDFSNPTGKSLNIKQREKIADIIGRKSSFLIEDGAYSFLDFKGEFKKPISALYENSFHLGSFSKIVAPGLRVGWIRAKKEFIEDILVTKEALDLHTSTLNQMILNQYLEENNLFEHIKKIRDEYKKKMEFMSICLKKHMPSFKFKKAKGGMFIYGKFEEDSFVLAKKALEKNIAFVPASVFFHDNRDSNEARFNFTNCDFNEIENGIIKLSNLLTKKEKIA